MAGRDLAADHGKTFKPDFPEIKATVIVGVYSQVVDIRKGHRVEWSVGGGSTINVSRTE